VEAPPAGGGVDKIRIDGESLLVDSITKPRNLENSKLALFPFRVFHLSCFRDYFFG
jgi:hypothetical protein